MSYQAGTELYVISQLFLGNGYGVWEGGEDEAVDKTRALKCWGEDR